MKELTYCLLDDKASLAVARSLSPQQLESNNRLAPSRLRFLLRPFAILFLITCIQLTTLAQAESGAPKIFLLKANDLITTREHIKAGDRKTESALAKLRADAEKALNSGPFSVTSKTVTPPSGDKRDYMSQAPYFWPDPKTQTGLPYIRRDGERNPEIDKIDNHRVLDQMQAAVETLSLAYFFTHEERYAAKATELLRTFFLKTETRMNPNLEYAQGIPGINTGRGIGLIETRGLTRVVDAIGLLRGAKAWSDADQRGMENWFDQFLRWMLESKNGKDESAAKNNHGTYYDVQVVSFALFLGQRELARKVLETAKQKRIALQIEPDGRQPLELSRTKAWGYSVGNLDGLMLLARLGESVNVDLWNYETSDGRSIRKALNFLTPFAFGEQKWPYQQLGQWPPQMLYSLLRRASARYPDPQIAATMSKLPAVEPTDRQNLLSGVR